MEAFCRNLGVARPPSATGRAHRRLADLTAIARAFVSTPDACPLGPLTEAK
jgi:hypothetical protein